MQLSKTLLQAMIVAATIGTITSCKKPEKPEIQKKNQGEKPGTNTAATDGCPACGMG